jgi:hypothetical protein
MTTTYRLNVDELSFDLLNSIKATFKNKEIEITVTEAVDETSYLLSSEANNKHLQQSEHLLQQGKGVTFSVQELEEKFGNK